MYGSPDLYVADILQAEEFYEDLFQRGGHLSLWSLPYSSYWLDFGLYILIRSFTPDAQTAFPAFSAMLAVLFSLSAWFAVWPMADSPERKRAAGLCCCVFALFICAGNPYSYYLCRVLFHALTAIFVCISAGCLVRLLLGASGIWVHALLFFSIAASAASDGMFLLWFVIPACATVAALFLLGRLPLRRAVMLAALLVLPILAGKGIDSLVKPEFAQSANHIKPAFRRFLPALTALADQAVAFFTASPRSMAVGLICGLTFIIALFRRRNRIFPGLIAVMFLCTIAGYAINGALSPWYSISFWSLVLLLLLAFGASQMPVKLSGLICAALVLSMGVDIFPRIARRAQEYRPPYTDCITAIAREHGVREAFACYGDARPLQYLSGLDITTSPINYTYFLMARDLTTIHGKPERAPLIILPREQGEGMFRRDTIFSINGQPDRVFECGETPLSILFYKDGARLGTMRDYLLDRGDLEKSYPERDMHLWSGAAAISGITVTEVSSLFRLNRQFIVLHLNAQPEAVFGKQLTVYMAGNKDKYPRRLAARKLSANGSSPADMLWKRLAWSKTFTLNAENTFTSPDGTGTWFFFRSPDRETKKWLMAAVASEGAFVRLF